MSFFKINFLALIFFLFFSNDNNLNSTRKRVAGKKLRFKQIKNSSLSFARSLENKTIFIPSENQSISDPFQIMPLRITGGFSVLTIFATENEAGHLKAELVWLADGRVLCLKNNDLFDGLDEDNEIFQTEEWQNISNKIRPTKFWCFLIPLIKLNACYFLDISTGNIYAPTQNGNSKYLKKTFKVELDDLNNSQIIATSLYTSNSCSNSPTCARIKPKTLNPNFLINFDEASFSNSSSPNSSPLNNDDKDEDEDLVKELSKYLLGND